MCFLRVVNCVAGVRKGGKVKVPLLDLRFQLEGIRDEILKAIEDVVDSTRYIMGPNVSKLEEQIAEYCQTDYAIGVSSGTDALLASLMALGVGNGDVVITTPYSFFATAGAIVRLSATPVFVDIDRKTFNLSPNSLDEWFRKNQKKVKKVKAVIAVHLFGQCADMDRILEIAGRYGVPVIEDAAQAIGARYPSKSGVKKAGSMGIAGCFSFFPSKNLGCMGDGGMITTRDAFLADKIRKIRNHGAYPKYYHSIVGGNFRLDEIQAAILLVKLKKLEEWHKARQKNAEYYNRKFENTLIETPSVAYDFDCHIFNQYVILVPEKRDELRKFLLESGIGCEIYYPVPFHLQECFRYLGYKKGDFPISEFVAERSLAIPVFPGLTEEQQNYVVDKILEFFNRV